MVKCPKCTSDMIDMSRSIVALDVCCICKTQFDALAETSVPETTKPTESVKFDSDKPALQYIPMEALFEMGKAFGYGSKKYGGYNFQLTGLEVTRCLAAAVRHIYQFLSGQDNDAESGNSHLGHALAAIGMAIYSLHHHPNKDDRFKKCK